MHSLFFTVLLYFFTDENDEIFSLVPHIIKTTNRFLEILNFMHC